MYRNETDCVMSWPPSNLVIYDVISLMPGCCPKLLYWSHSDVDTTKRIQTVCKLT